MKKIFALTIGAILVSTAVHAQTETPQPSAMSTLQVEKPGVLYTYTATDVTIPSNGLKLAAKVYMPNLPAGQKPGVAVILGPVTSVKEQVSKEYATRLATRGYAAVIFDPRYYGSSEGEPRQFENGDAKAEDINNVVQYMLAQGQVDANNVIALGICQGANWVTRAATQNPAIKKLVLVSGNFLYKESIESYFRDTDFKDISMVEKRIAGGKAALDKYKATGMIDYIPAVGKADAPDRLMPNQTANQYYSTFVSDLPYFISYRGKWQNQVAKMSEYELWQTKINEDFNKVKTPTLFIATERSATSPAYIPILLKGIQNPKKELKMISGKGHIQFYNDSETIDAAVNVTSNWLAS